MVLFEKQRGYLLRILIVAGALIRAVRLLMTFRVPAAACRSLRSAVRFLNTP